MARLLVVDDEEDIRQFLAEYLSDQGEEVLLAATGAEALDMVGSRAPDLVLLDLVLRGENGIDIAKRIRAVSQVPIIMLTGRGDAVDRILGLEIGADDFVNKPFNSRELLARIRAVLRRTQSAPSAKPEAPQGAEPAGETAEFSGWRLDMASRGLAEEGGAAIALTAGEFELLTAFLRSPQRVLSREFLLDAINSEDSFERSIDVRVLRLRRKMETDAAKPALISAVRGAGYMFLPKVRWSGTP